MTLSLLAIAALANGLLIGLIPVLIDGLRPALKSRVADPSDKALGWFAPLFYLAWVPAMPLAGWLLDLWPHRAVLLYCGLLPLILGFAWLALSRNSKTLLPSAIFLGVAYSFLTTATIRLMTVAFFPDWAADYPMRIASLNLGFMATGAGALLGPWIVSMIDRWSGTRQGLLYLSVALLIPAIFTAMSNTATFSTPAANPATWSEVFTYAPMLLIVGVMLIFFAIENTLEYWPEAYLKEIGYEGNGLTAGLFIFWLSFTVARGAAAWWLYYHPENGALLTLVLIFVSALVIGNLAGGFELGSGSFGFWMLGACYGPLLPGFLGIALDLFPNSHPLPNSALGVLLALSGFDTLVMRPAMNRFTRNRAARSVMYVPTVLALMACAALLVLAFIRN